MRRYDSADAHAKVQQDLVVTNALLTRAKFGFANEPHNREEILQNQHTSGTTYLNKLHRAESLLEFLFNNMLRTCLHHPIIKIHYILQKFLCLEEKQYCCCKFLPASWTLLDQFDGFQNSHLSACSLSNVLSDIRWRCISRSLAQASQIRFCLNKTHFAMLDRRASGLALFRAKSYFCRPGWYVDASRTKPTAFLQHGELR